MSNQHDTPARITGLLVFLAVIGLLVFVFVAAHTLFNTPAPAVPTTPAPSAGAATPSVGVEIGRSFGQLGRQILLLLLMCIAGSVIASKGIQLFFAARPIGGAQGTNDKAPAAGSPQPEPAPTPSAANGQGVSSPPAAAEPAPGPKSGTGAP